MPFSSRAASVTAVAGLAFAVPATAGATPSRGITSVALSDHVVNGVDYVVKELTIAPGGSTGWHMHPKPISGIVVKGTLTHNMADCSVDGIYHAGQTIIEQAGLDHVHIGRNLGTTPVILDALYVDPVGTPQAVDEPNPGCAFQ